MHLTLGALGHPSTVRLFRFKNSVSIHSFLLCIQKADSSAHAGCLVSSHCSIHQMTDLIPIAPICGQHTLISRDW